MMLQFSWQVVKEPGTMDSSEEDGRILFLNPLLLVSLEFDTVQPPSKGNATDG